MGGAAPTRNVEFVISRSRSTRGKTQRTVRQTAWRRVLALIHCRGETDGLTRLGSGRSMTALKTLYAVTSSAVLVVLCAQSDLVAAASFEVPAGLDLSPAFAVLDEERSTPSGLIARLGRGTKSARNPLFGQTLPWEPRIDNGYANVAFDPTFSAEKPWRLWYDAFTSCNDEKRDDKGRYLHCGGGKRHHSGLYAHSSDGLTWEKPALDSGVTYKAGVGFCCDLKTCECTPGEAGAVKTNIYTMVANGNTVLLDDRPAKVGGTSEQSWKDDVLSMF